MWAEKLRTNRILQFQLEVPANAYSDRKMVAELYCAVIFDLLQEMAGKLSLKSMVANRL